MPKWMLFPTMTVVAVAACQSSTDAVCTDYSTTGLVITVRDSVTSAGVAPAGTVVLAREGAYVDTAPRGLAGAAGTTFTLAQGRAGTYTVRAEAAGYAPWERASVRVTKPGCQVRTAWLTAWLQPQRP